MRIFLKKFDDFNVFSQGAAMLPMSEAQEHFIKYWLNLSLENDGKLPSRDDIKPHEATRHLPYVVIIDALRKPLDFIYRLYGSAVREQSNADYTGKHLCEIDGKGPDSTVWQTLVSVIEAKAPLYKEVPYIGPYEDYKRVSTLYLPLASDHKDPDKVLLVSHFNLKSSFNHNAL